LSVEALNPTLAKEWHPTKNGSLTPRDVTPFSSKKVWWLCSKGHEWETMVNPRSKGSGCPYCSGNRVSDDNCLQTINPTIAKEWHPTKNGSQTPRNVTAFSGKKVWWLCPKGHEWEATLFNRSSGQVCPYCSGRKVSDKTRMQTVNPNLAKEWHPTKNGSLTPMDVSFNFYKKVWWLCPKGHEWEARIADRNKGSGCPYCSGRKVSDNNRLQTLNPSLSKEWHPTKNGSLTPMDVSFGCHKKVWWLCPKGHEWEATVNSRSNGQGCGCPYCAGKRVGYENCLQTLNPTLAKEWHTTKNISLTPKDVTVSSNKKVYWQCSKGHEWQATVNSRSNGQGCPACFRQKRKRL